MAAAVDFPRITGEQKTRMEEWAGTEASTASLAGIQERLGELGPGSSAIVGCFWKEQGGGHWFNAVNESGTVKAVDGQSSTVQAWPPSRDGVGYDESMMGTSFAIFFRPDGKVVRDDNR
ncbi:MAG TPA: toxin glutamine deamidase domain-containing protein [Trebonia sp.]|nr:toxin glutamine deamidase domain-containing protein [Trebonia sp.]